MFEQQTKFERLSVEFSLYRNLTRICIHMKLQAAQKWMNQMSTDAWHEMGFALFVKHIKSMPEQVDIIKSFNRKCDNTLHNANMFVGETDCSTNRPLIDHPATIFTLNEMRCKWHWAPLDRWFWSYWCTCRSILIWVSQTTHAEAHVWYFILELELIMKFWWFAFRIQFAQTTLCVKINIDYFRSQSVNIICKHVLGLQ